MAILEAITELPYKRLDGTAVPLRRGTEWSAGYDLGTPVPFEIGRGKLLVVGLRVAVEIPRGWVGLVKERSSLAQCGLEARALIPEEHKFLAGVIDADYRGPVKLLLLNHGTGPIRCLAGDYVAQLVVVPCLTAPPAEKSELSATGRGDGGFGSTGRS